MISTSSFLFERNGFTVYRLIVLGSIYFVAEKQIGNSIRRYIRKSLDLIERLIDSE